MSGVTFKKIPAGLLIHPPHFRGFLVGRTVQDQVEQHAGPGGRHPHLHHDRRGPSQSHVAAEGDAAGLGRHPSSPAEDFLRWEVAG